MKEKFKDKIIKLADEIAQEVYPLTFKFPKSELFALGNQLRRATLSVPANLIEGYARRGEKEKRRFFNIAYASLAESKYLVYFAFKQGYITEVEYLDIKQKMEQLSKLLWSLLVKMKADKLTS